MSNSDTERLIKQVEDQTGYRVVLGTTDSITSDAEMISAATEHPVHVINVSKNRLAFADYIIAIQCSMLMTMWSHPSGIPQFILVPDKVDSEVRKTAKVLESSRQGGGGTRAELGAPLLRDCFTNYARHQPS
jgi:mitochondrial fission protein ELM1